MKDHGESIRLVDYALNYTDLPLSLRNLVLRSSAGSRKSGVLFSTLIGVYSMHTCVYACIRV